MIPHGGQPRLRRRRAADHPYRAATGLALAGEIDEFTYSPLVATLDELTRGQQEVHVDLADVAYCDLAGLRAIVRLAGPAGEGGDRPPGGAAPLPWPSCARCWKSSAGTPFPGLSLDRQGASPAGH